MPSEIPSNHEVQRNPTDSQGILRSIYIALPTRDVAIARLRASLGNRDPSDMSENEQAGALTNAVAGALHRWEHAEVPRMNTMRLEKLLPAMPATQSFKDFLEDKIIRANLLGVDRTSEETDSSSFFHILGVCETDAQTEGIFSPDPVLRQTIERSAYSLLKSEMEGIRKKTLQALGKKDHALVRHFVEIGKDQQEQLDSWKTEYQTMYGTDIEETQP